MIVRIIQLIRDTEAAHGCRFTFELLPPLKGEDMSGVFGAIDTLMPYGPAYINVTCHREELVEVLGADGRSVRHVVRRRPGTVGISAAIRARYGVEVVPHLICAGLSRYDLEEMCWPCRATSCGMRPLSSPIPTGIRMRPDWWLRSRP